MALERIGLGGVFTFDGNQGVRAMKQPRDEFGRFVKSANQVPPALNRIGLAATSSFAALRGAAGKLGGAVSQMGTALRGAGVAALPAAAGLGFAVKQAADFEQGMANVGAILLDVSDKDMSRLELKAKQMGATTVFSASQSAEAMQYMARAGFNADQIITGLDGVMNAAAADGIGLADATNIVSNVLKGMGLQASDTTRVADVLALTSARTNTNMMQLGEAFRYAQTKAKSLRIPLETTSAMLGVLADAGLQGSIGGTSFTNMLIKLGKPSKKATGFIKKLGGTIYEFKDGSLDVVRTMRSFEQGMNKIKSSTKKASMMTEIFGVRGEKAIGALETAFQQGKFTGLIDELQKADGAAKRMADRRLDTFQGQITLLKSAVEGFNIEVGGLLLDTMTSGSKNAVKGLSNIVKVMQELNSETGLTDKTAEEAGGTVVAIAQGIREGFLALKNTIVTVRSYVASLAQKFGVDLGKGGVKSIAKIVTMFVVFAGALAPILLGLGGIVFFITTVLIPAVSAIGAVFGVVAAIFSSVFVLPVLAAIGVAVLAWLHMKEAIIAGADAFMEFAAPAVDFLKVKVVGFIQYVIASVKEMYDGFAQAMAFLKPLFIGTFKVIGKVVGIVFGLIAMGLGNLLEFAKPVLNVFKEIGKFILEDIVNGLVSMIKLIVKAADAINFPIPKELREFSKQGTFRIVKETKADITKPKIKTPEEKMADALRETTADNKSATEVAHDLLYKKTEQKAAGAKTPKVEANVTVEDKKCLQIENSLKVDGRAMSVASSRHKQQIHERAGFKAKPYARRIALEHGASPA